jgi:hypothetical protein
MFSTHFGLTWYSKDMEALNKRSAERKAMGSYFMESQQYKELKLHEKLLYDFEETLSSGDQAELLFKVVKEFAGHKSVLTRIKDLYEKHYDDLYGE